MLAKSKLHPCRQAYRRSSAPPLPEWAFHIILAITRIAVTMLNDPVITVDTLCCMALASKTLSITSCVELLEGTEPSIGSFPVKTFETIVSVGKTWFH